MSQTLAPSETPLLLFYFKIIIVMCPHGSVRTKIFSLWFNNVNHYCRNFTKGSWEVLEGGKKSQSYRKRKTLVASDFFE